MADEMEDEKEAAESRMTVRTSGFDFSRFRRRRIALMFCYLGWNYDGLVTQSHTRHTVEEAIFLALEKTKLIESRESCAFARSGRTDKGVSAFKQVASLIVRSRLSHDPNVFSPSQATTESSCSSRNTDLSELSYCKMLNGVLPPDIRMLAWTPVTGAFSARHSCTRRRYKYFMPRADLHVQRMEEASQLLVGEFDFRNFCRIDKNEARLEMSYVRRIHNVSLRDRGHDSGALDDMLELTVDGSGFLWHQIRCIVAVLLEIGRGNESPEIIPALLDVDNHPRRPQYTMAVQFPLCLFECSYSDDDLQWTWDADSIAQTIALLQSTWTDLQCKATMVQTMIEALQEGDESRRSGHFHGVHRYLDGGGRSTKAYIPIMKRATCEGLEEKREKRRKKVREGSGE